MPRITARTIHDAEGDEGDDRLPMTAQQPCTPGHEAAVIDLLLEEYRTLRDEMNGKIAAQENLLTFGGASIAIMVSLTARLAYLIAALVPLLTLGAVYYLRNAYGILRISRHIVTLEDHINTLAGIGHGTKIPLLTWEHESQTLARRGLNPAYRYFSRDRSDARRGRGTSRNAGTTD